MPVVIMLRSIYPSDKAVEVSKVFLKSATRKLPPFLKGLGVWVGPSEKGIQVYSVYEVEDEKMGEGLRELTRLMAAYSQVQGYNWWIEPLAKPRDAISLLGLAQQK